MKDDNLDQVLSITIGKLLDMLDDHEDIDDDGWERMKKILALILWAAKNGIDKDMAHDMALLAKSMLRA